MDVLFLDSDRNIIEIKENLKPFRWYFPRNKARYIIELPAGTVASKAVTIGDMLSF